MRKFNLLLIAPIFCLTCQLLVAQDASALTQNGLASMQGGRFAEAEPLLIRALAIAKFDRSTALYNLASLYHRQGRYLDAIRLHRQALMEIEREKGATDPAVAESLSDLGVLYRAMGKHSEAIDALERAERIVSGTAAYATTATVLNNLAISYYDTGEREKAEAALVRALDLAESRPECRSELPYVLNSLGRHYVDQKKFKEGEAAFRKAVELLAVSTGTRHPDYATALHNLSTALHRQRRFREAESSAHTSIAILEMSVGPEAPALANPLSTYAEILRGLGRNAEARDYARRAKAIVRPDAGTVDARALRQSKSPTRFMID